MKHWGGTEGERDDTYKGESHAQGGEEGGRQHRNVTGPDQSLFQTLHSS